MALSAILSVSLVSFVTLIHVYILVLECFLWTTPRGHKSFGLTPSFAHQTKALAQNQGLYNGFLAAGLAWGLLHPVPEFGAQIQIFFLGCVAVAGVVGAATTGQAKIVFIQSIPALGAGLAVWLL
jgi:putative membrane protein